jgi:hypothetical protein
MMPLNNLDIMSPFTHYVDANHMHDIISGCSVTGILHMIKQGPVDCFTTKQATVESAPCIEQIIDLRNTIHYLAVPIQQKLCVW